MYDIEILQQSAKKVETKRQKDFGDKPYACRSYRGKLVGGSFATTHYPHHPHHPHPE